MEINEDSTEVLSLVDKLKKKKQPRNVNAVSAWGKIDGTLTVAQYHYCHASMNSQYHEAISVPDILLSQYQAPIIDEGIIAKFFEWLFNYSPFQEAFISKDAHKVIDRKVVLVDPEQPANLVGGALIASRFGTEKYTPTYKLGSRPLMWHRLVELGVHPNLAFTLACSIVINDIEGDYDRIKAIKTFTYSPDQVASHTALHTGVHGLNDFTATHINFFHNKKTNPLKSFKELKTQSYSSRLWEGPKPKYDVNGVVLRKLKEELKNIKDSLKNPFSKAKIEQANVGSNTFDFDPAMEVMAKLSREIVENI